MDEKTPIFGDPHEREGVSKVGTSSSARQVYHDSTQNPTTKYIMMGSVGVISIMVFIALILCIYRGASTGKQGFLYFLVGVSLIGFIVIQAFLFKFLQSGDLAKGKTWFLYFMGICTFVESIFVAVIVMN
ncbi:uncharacterized protein [Asterias amurensis]|uniref:uncharacterized protein n=1 Tax=Asterias amurensis TaxID=7602 RepID=UPI003AB3EE1E